MSDSLAEKAGRAAPKAEEGDSSTKTGGKPAKQPPEAPPTVSPEAAAAADAPAQAKTAGPFKKNGRPGGSGALAQSESPGSPASAAERQNSIAQKQKAESHAQAPPQAPRPPLPPPPDERASIFQEPPPPLPEGPDGASSAPPPEAPEPETLKQAAAERPKAPVQQEPASRQDGPAPEQTKRKILFDYKDPLSLYPFLEGGKIPSAHGSGLNRARQKRLRLAVKKARALGLLPSHNRAYDDFERPAPISVRPFDC